MASSRAEGEVFPSATSLLYHSAMTISEALREAERLLSLSGIESARLDAQVLLAHVLGVDKAYLIANFNRQVHPSRLGEFHNLIARRAAREPLQYITGHQEFWGLDFIVTPDVLIPRPETELLVEQALARASGGETIVDVGTGSGCIAVALAKELKSARIIATDISEKAISVAKLNAVRHMVDLRIEFRVGDLLAAVSDLKGQIDMIVCNPPYIGASELATIQPEVRRYEPRIALTDEADGLNFSRRLISQAEGQLKPGGLLILELAYGRSQDALKLFDPYRWRIESVLPDLQGVQRCLVAKSLP